MKVKIILFIFISMWLALVVRVFSLAVSSNNYYEKLSLENSIKIEQIAPVRGEIVDVKERPIAINKLGFKIKLKPHLLSKSAQGAFEEEIDFLMHHLPKLDRQKLITRYKKSDSYYNHNYIEVVDFISYDEILPIYSILNIRENLKIEPSPMRYYPYGSVAAHVIGYVAKANSRDIEDDSLLELIGYAGKTGVEKYYNSFLQGEAGERKIKVNANNQEIEELSYSDAKEDRRLKLTIDIELQKLISELFVHKAGAVVVMDINGSVLALGSYPEYDLNQFVSGISQAEWNRISTSLDRPFRNKVVNDVYPPGSTIKTGLGLLYITTDIDKHTKVNCESAMPLGNRVFRCWKKDGHGYTDIKKAIRESCDDYFYKGSLRVGIDKMSEGLKRYGLGEKTGIDLPNEYIGTVPSRSWKMQKYRQPWYIGETVNTSIGQGDFLTTPLQIANFTALMATGRLPTPHVADMLQDEPYRPAAKEVFNEHELQELPLIQRAMYEVCNEPSGTAMQYVRSSKIQMAGKTGTAQVVAIMQDIEKRKLEHEMEYYKRSHAWFTTYGPYKNPQYIVSVMVEHGGHGGAAAGGIVSEIYNKLYELGYITKAK